MQRRDEEQSKERRRWVEREKKISSGYDSGRWSEEGILEKGEEEEVQCSPHSTALIT